MKILLFPLETSSNFHLLADSPTITFNFPTRLSKLATLRQNLSRDELDNYKKFKDNPSHATEAISDDDDILEGATSKFKLENCRSTSAEY